jgi:hypothetical protein
MVITDNSVRSINIALLDLDKKIKNIQLPEDDKTLDEAIAYVKKYLYQHLNDGSTYNINIAGNASTADHALSADTANHATSADTATSATNADYATSAGSATNADTATSATNADYATEAGHATSADTATNSYTKTETDNLLAGEIVMVTETKHLTFGLTNTIDLSNYVLSGKKVIFTVLFTNEFTNASAFTPTFNIIGKDITLTNKICTAIRMGSWVNVKSYYERSSATYKCFGAYHPITFKLDCTTAGSETIAILDPNQVIQQRGNSGSNYYYIVRANGFCEQYYNYDYGSNASNIQITVNLPVYYANTGYFVQVQPVSNNTSYYMFYSGVKNRTTSQVACGVYSPGSDTARWVSVWTKGYVWT